MRKIENSELLESIYGTWPSFHDAEIHELRLSRVGGSPAPYLELVIHVFQGTDEIDEKGYIKTINHALVTIRFDTIDCLKLEDFNHQNVLLDLEINDAESNNNWFEVYIATSYGCRGSFTCEEITVIEVKDYSV